MNRGHVPSNRASQHVFSRVPQAEIPRSRFDRSFALKTTFDEGYLVPVMVDEMLPGDTFNLRLHAFARMSTPIFPIMDNVYLETFFFAVPVRLVWDNWAAFNGEQTDPDPLFPAAATIPQVVLPAVTGCLEGSLCDYFGIPPGIVSVSINSLPLRCYNLIWNEWFRDENLQDSLTVETGNGPDTYADYVLQRRGKRHDYFTSCLPWPQKGPDVSLPLGTTAPVSGIGFFTGNALPPQAANNVVDTAAGLTNYTYASLIKDAPIANGYQAVYIRTSTNGTGVNQTPDVYTDLSTATAATINDLREAFQTQKLYERDARGGTRYTEIIKSHFGVTSPDARLQRPEYLGGGSHPFIVSPIAQTSATSGTNALGDLGAYSTCAASGHGFTYSATEHCYIIGLVATRADLTYQQGLDRLWSRSTRFDFYWPALAHLGEQAVLNKEIYLQGTADDDLVFGYQERYAEYRYKPSMVTGLFRSAATGSLDSWHLAQDFGSLPALDDTFIVENAPMARVEAVSAEPDFILDCFFDLKCARPMPVYAVPGLIDHF